MKTNKYLTMAAAALMMAACSSEDVPQVDSATNTPIQIHAMVAELENRAGIEDAGDFNQFNLSVVNSNSDTYTYNVVVEKSGTGWAPVGTQMLWQNSTAPVTVTAATFSLDGAQNLAVQADQSTDANVIASDHLYMAATSQNYAATNDKAAGAINVNFSHIMSKVNLTITLADEFDVTENPISDVTFQGTVARRNYNAGNWTNINGVTATDIKAFTGTYTVPTQANPKATAQYEVILVPQTVTAGNFAVQFQIDGRLFKWTSANAVTLESGKQYTLALTAGDEKVGDASFSSAAWGNGNNNNVATE